MTASVLKQDPKQKGSNKRSFILTWTHGMQINNLPCTEQAVKTKPKQGKSFSFIFHRFWTVYLLFKCRSVA